MPLPPIDTHDPAEMADLIAAFRAESLANERLIDKLETQVQRLTMDLDYEISARKAAEQALGELPHENETLRFALHAAEMRNRDYADGTAIQEMAQEIAELQAELAAVPKWTRITDDPATWPPEESMVVGAWRLAVRGWWIEERFVKHPPTYHYWWPIPEIALLEADDA